MKTVDLRRITLILLGVVCLCACEKPQDDPFVETSTGKDSLGFKANGESVTYYYISHAWDGSGLPPENLVSGTISDDCVQINAILGNLSYTNITISVPLAQVVKGARLMLQDFSVALPYLCWTATDNTGNWEGVNVTPVFEEGELYIRYFDYAKGIISGNFSLTGYMDIPDGVCKQTCISTMPIDYTFEPLAAGKTALSISDGTFDVKLDD